MHYWVKDEYIELWGPDADYYTPVSDEEVQRLAEDWGKPVSELLDQLEPVTIAYELSAEYGGEIYLLGYYSSEEEANAAADHDKGRLSPDDRETAVYTVMEIYGDNDIVEEMEQRYFHTDDVEG